MLILFALLIGGYVVDSHGFWWGLAAGAGYFIGVKLLELVVGGLFMFYDFSQGAEIEPEQDDVFRRRAWACVMSTKWVVFVIVAALMLPSDLSSASVHTQEEYAQMLLLFVTYSSILTLVSYGFFAKEYKRGLKQWRWLESESMQGLIGLTGVIAVLAGIANLGIWVLLILIVSFFAAFTATMTFKSYAPHVAGVLLICALWSHALI